MNQTIAQTQAGVGGQGPVHCVMQLAVAPVPPTTFRSSSEVRFLTVS